MTPLLLAVLALPLIAGNHSGAGETRKSLIGYWNFDEDLRDLSGRGNHLVLSGGARIDAEVFKSGRGSLRLDGQFRSLAFSKKLAGWKGGNLDVTISAWSRTLKAPDTIYGYSVISLGDTQPRGHFFLRSFVNPNWNFGSCGGTRAAAVSADDGTADDWTCGTSESHAGRWTHLAATYDSRNYEVRLYVDGLLERSRRLSEPLLIGKELMIGVDQAGENWLLGNIDEAAVFDRVLSGSEIWKLAHDTTPAGLEGIAVSAAEIGDARQVGDYPFSRPASILRLFSRKSETSSTTARPLPSKETASPSRPEIPDNFALVVGVERYSRVPPAPFAANDAEAVSRELAAAGFPARNIISLYDADATGASIQKYLKEWLPKNTVPASSVLIYFSGHGAPDPRSGKPYLVPWDGDPRFLKTTAISIAGMLSSLEILKAGKVTVVLDTCFSGLGGRSVLPFGTRPLVTKVLAPRSDDERIVILSAAGRDQIAGVLQEERQGLFTHYFLEGLSGKAAVASGSVTVRSLFDFLRPRVEREAKRENRDQIPELLGFGEDHILVGPPNKVY